jgi:hypothetical protein
MSDSEQQTPLRPAPTSLVSPPSAPVGADVVAARRIRRHDPAIPQRLRHGLLRIPLGSERPPRW